MPKICYVPRAFSQKSQLLIARANSIIQDYLEQDLVLTLRQLYYRFVASGWIENRDREYKRLGSVINDGRLAGLIDWEAIEDRGRNLLSPSCWSSPASIIDACAQQYSIDLWVGQLNRVEVWVEKQALESVVEKACSPLNVACFACKGYVSQSEMWRAANRLRRYSTRGQYPVIIHLGDHDPSGIDMTRDIRDRMKIFCVDLEVNRIALNMDQVQKLNPPPNPAKLTDSRVKGYIAEFGRESWELDAIEPAALQKLIQEEIKSYMDDSKFKARQLQEKQERAQLQTVSNRFDEIVEEMM